MTYHFKIRIKDDRGERWADANKVFAHLHKRFTDKENRSKVNFENRKQKFINSLDDFTEEFGQEMIDDFMEYWVEPNKSETKMRFELEKTWSLSRRLKKWNQNGFGRKKITALSFKLDSTGKFYTAYCEKCLNSEFYEKPQYEESRCCNAKLLGKRRSK